MKEKILKATSKIRVYKNFLLSLILPLGLLMTFISSILGIIIVNHYNANLEIVSQYLFLIGILLILFYSIIKCYETIKYKDIALNKAKNIANEKDLIDIEKLRKKRNKIDKKANRKLDKIDRR
ncbi:MAG: hypothetical protein HRS57_03060 [Mycoplasmataceae bacterium]|nr:hypothetical protein [Mycoplasmataceae bacterium]